MDYLILGILFIVGFCFLIEGMIANHRLKKYVKNEMEWHNKYLKEGAKNGN